jgi:hypothetical protein
MFNSKHTSIAVPGVVRERPRSVRVTAVHVQALANVSIGECVVDETTVT